MENLTGNLINNPHTRPFLIYIYKERKKAIVETAGRIPPNFGYSSRKFLSQDSNSCQAGRYSNYRKKIPVNGRDFLSHEGNYSRSKEIAGKESLSLIQK